MPDAPSDLVVFPHFSGTSTPSFDVEAKGTIVGLTLNTTVTDIFKAIIEGATLEMAIILGYMEQAGICVRELRAVGGGAKSPANLRLRANILNRPLLSLRTSEAGAQGAAILAGVGARLYDSPDTAAKRLTHVSSTYNPEPDLARQYQNALNKYRRLHQLVLRMYHQD
ncbi:MAG: hypothetical protein HYX78_04625 [Armatimonadetes bacterium]|nr:hypothetical protein [Armatimonadota bacterium]